MLLTEIDHARVEAAIAAAEANTAGEIYAIVSNETHRYPGVVLAVAALTAFVAPLAAVLAGADFARLLPAEWSEDPVRPALEAYAAVQALLFIAAAALLWFTGWGRHLAPGAIRRARVHDVALRQFLAKGLHQTAARTGVLLYVSAPDHVAEVVADEGIYAKVGPDHWGDSVAALTAGLRAGRPGDGFVAAIGLAGAVLAEHFPRQPGDINELPDRIVQI